MATITRIFAPGGSNLTAVATFGSSTNVVYGPCVQSNDTLTVDFGHLATTSGARVSFTFWEDLDGDGVHSAHERATTWWPPLTGHAVCVTNELSFGMFDRDNDGMLDDWEIQYGLSPTTRSDAAQDTDGDGLVNLHEYWTGMDPLVPDGSNTLFSVAARSVDTRIMGLDATNALPIFVNYTANATAKTFVPNTNCWLWGIDHSCASMWHLDAGVRSQWAGTLISSRHMITATHHTLGLGVRYLFRGRSGTIYTRRTIASKPVGDTDICVNLLEEEIPDDVTPACVLPSDFASHIKTGIYLPMVCFDQEEKALVQDVFSLGYKRESEFSYVYDYVCGEKSADSQRATFYEDVIIGDSGNPRFLLVGDTLVLLNILWKGGGGWGVLLSAHIDEIEAIMNEQMETNGVYRLRQIDLSHYELPHEDNQAESASGGEE